MGQPPPYVWPGVKSVATLYDLFGHSEAARSKDIAMRLAVRQHRRYKEMLAIVCISDATRMTAIAELNLNDAKCLTVPPALARLDSNHPPATAITESSGKPFLLHVGILTARKNPRVLLESFAIVSQRHPDLELWCVGPYQVNPEAAENVIRVGRTLGIDRRVRLVGDVTDSDLAHLYRACSAFVFPSLAEGFGYPAVEAISHHAQCVLADVPALHEAAGTLAQYADPTDSVAFARAIDQVLEPRQVAAKAPYFAELADKWVQRFSRAEVGVRLLAVYESAVRRSDS
jgi:glycosyltransferase involved in cell wall biosynthesis